VELTVTMLETDFLSFWGGLSRSSRVTWAWSLIRLDQAGGLGLAMIYNEFPERVVYHKAIQMYKTVCGDAPDYLKNDFVFTSEIHSRLL